MPFMCVPDDTRTIAPPSRIDGNAFLDGEESPAGVDAEHLVEMLRRDGRGRRDLHVADAGDQDVKLPLFAADLVVQPVEVAKVGDVALGGRDIPSDRGFGLVELPLTPAGDEE